MSSFAGMINGRFFGEVPSHIDRKKQPGFSELPRFTFGDWLLNLLSLKIIWGTPTFIWSLIALAIYIAYPYDLSPNSAAAIAPISKAFFLERFPLWFIVIFVYYAFWHITLYYLNWAQRPFIQNRKYNWNKMCHNLFWLTCGVVIWTGFDNVFAYLWASGRLPFMPDSEVFGSLQGILRFSAGFVLVPAWRDVHFYFAHRLLHFKPMFAQVHSLHHRNTDIEPFSGLTMHPIEHLYYYACILPSLMFYASPFHFLWNGVHLLLSPGASHSGWEDHWQADGFHYMHHRYFECNYAGFSAGFLDVRFKTFMPCFKEESGKAKARDDAKSTLKGLPTKSFLFYLLTSAACIGIWAIYANATASNVILVSRSVALLVSFVSGFGPVLIACGMAVVQWGFHSLLEPFQQKPLIESFVHVFVGSLFCSFPVSMISYLAIM